ncbi:hypothetical protein ACXWOQ_10295, partial [Streptococcus pyogenes]
QTLAGRLLVGSWLRIGMYVRWDLRNAWVGERPHRETEASALMLGILGRGHCLVTHRCKLHADVMLGVVAPDGQVNG